MNEPRKITNPFPGLRPFETDEYRLFYGREGQSDELVSRLGRARFLAVVGTSGSGKSSLVRAGLLPALRGGMMAGVGAGWRIAVMRPGGDPVGNLARVLAERGVLEEAGGGLAPAEGEAVIEATLRGGSLGLVGAVQQARLSAQDKLLVIVDQFEELFRFRAARAASSADDAAAFVKLLLEAARQREQNIYVVLTMRSDFLGDCAQFQSLPEAINEGQYLIPRMNRDERRAAIVGPVRVARGRIGEPLVNRLLNDVGDSPDQLPILQHALMRTWDYWAAHRRDGEPLGLEHYEAIGTMAGALSEHADEAFNELRDERSRHIAEALFKALTERGSDNREVRRPTRLSEVCEIAGASTEVVVAVVEVFRREGRSFLMPPVGVRLAPDTVLDISHESLIRNWERLKEWVDEEAQSARIYRRLAEAAALNRNGEEGLLQDPGLHLTLDWREKTKPNAAWGRRYHPEFDAAIAYLEQSRASQEAELAEVERREQEELERERREMEQTRAFAEQQARSARRLRWAAAAMAVLFALSLGTAVYAFVMKARVQAFAASAIAERERADAERKDADAARARAEEARARAESLTNELQENNGKLEAARSESERQAKLADERAAEAELATKAARDARDNAEKARAAAEMSLGQAEASAKRSSLIREGLEASRRNNNKRASKAFRGLADNVEGALPNASESQATDLKFWRGWAFSNLGAAQLELGSSAEAKESYEKAREILEGVWPKERRRDNKPGTALFEMYYGLGRTYHEISMVGQEYREGGAPKKIEGAAYNKMAEAVLKDAIVVSGGVVEIQSEELVASGAKPTEEEAEGMADAYLNIARVYRDMSNLREAGEYFIKVIKLKQMHGDTDEVIAARKELAEFYRDQGLLIGAENAYKELIDEQEKAAGDVEAGFAENGQEIAESYNELSEVYKTQNTPAKNEKAEDAFAASMAIQRLAVRLRRVLSSPFGASTAADAADDFADAAGDAYAKLGEYDRALALYQYALNVRKEGAGKLRRNLWESYDRLTKLYRRDDFKDYARAEEYNQLLIREVSGDDPKTGRLVDAVKQCADLYAKDRNRLSEARAYYERALEIYARQDDWMNENIVLYKIGDMYAKQKMVPEWKEVALRRLELLTTQLSKIVGRTDALPRGSITLVSEYLNSVGEVALIQSRAKNDAEEAAAYQKAFEAYDFITRRVYNLRVLNLYAATLEKYERLLNRLGKQDEAAKVALSAKAVRVRAQESRNIQEQQSAQQTRAGAQQTPLTP